MKRLRAMRVPCGLFVLGLLALLLALPARAGVPIEHWQSSQGTPVYFVASTSLPLVDVQIDFAAGSMFDPAEKPGVAALTRAILDLGAGDLDENAIAERMADLGALFGGGADTDRASISLRVLSAPEKRQAAIDLLIAVLKSPRFDAAIFAREQARTVANLKDALTRPDRIAGRAFWQALYPRHPYGRQATPESVAAIGRDDLRHFWQAHYTVGNARITLVGDLSRAAAEALAEQLAASLPPGGAMAPPEAPEVQAGQEISLPHPAAQAHILLGLPAIWRGHPDLFPMLVGNYTLGGGGFVSRLMKEVRDKRGYAYSVYSTFSPLRQAGPFQIGLQTRRGQAAEALGVVRQVLDDFLRSGPDETELRAAQDYLTGSFPLRLDSNRKILDNVANIAFYGLPLDYLDTYQDKIRAVTAEQVRAAFARQLRPQSLVTVKVAAD